MVSARRLAWLLKSGCLTSWLALSVAAIAVTGGAALSVAQTANDAVNQEPLFTPGVDTMVWQDNFDKYPSMNYMRNDNTLNPWQAGRLPYSMVASPDVTLIPGRDETGQAVRGTVHDPGYFGQTGFSIVTPFGYNAAADGGYALSSMKNGAPGSRAGTGANNSGAYTSPQQILYIQVWFRISSGATINGAKGIEIWDVGGPPYGSGRIQTGWQIGGKFLNILDTSSDGPGKVINHTNQPVAPFWNNLNEGKWHRWTIASKRNTVYAGGVGRPSSRDGFSRAWIDGIKVMDYSASAVGVKPPGATGAWCNWDDVDQIGARLSSSIAFPCVIFGSLTDGMSWDWDDLTIWTVAPRTADAGPPDN